MTKTRGIKQRLIAAVLALLMTMTCLLGTTFAWFTDSVSSAGNKIVAGNLSIDLVHVTKDGEVSLKQTPTHKVFDYDKWEPGYTRVEALKVKNLGSLALKYQLSIEVAEGTAELGANGENLADVIEVYVIYGDYTKVDFADIKANGTYKGTLSEVMQKPAEFMNGQLLPNGKTLDGTEPEHTAVGKQLVTVALHMKEDAGNAYQKLSVGDVYVNLIATQWSAEEDSFGKDYDNNVSFPNMEDVDVVVDVTVENGIVKDAVTKDNVTVPAGVKVQEGTTQLSATIKQKNTSDTNVTLGENEIMRPLDVHVENVAADNTVAIIVNLGEVLPKGLNIGNYTLYHVENDTDVAMTAVSTLAELNAHNEFYYDPATGEVTVAMATFSEVALIADTENAWNGTVATAFAGGTGTETDPYIIANADQLAYMGDCVSNDNDNENYGSAYYKLIADVNIGGIENYNTNGRKVLFYPIGYNKVGGTTTDKGNWYTYGGAFSGTFDGTGHSISGIYQNTWAMVGDYSGTYYNDAMGLFGYVNGGTVKNLTIDNFYSEGEFAPTGCVAAYAAGEATFENIAITNSHPQTYNTGVAGIIGWDNGGDTEADASNFTFKNITVDDTNTVSALWGSWDVAAAGILGYLGTYSKANFENCNVAATIDVYNDVCGNYQYYWYRYCGAFIGTVDKRRDNGKGALDLSNVTATNCTVNFGDRHEYYYCEFEKNTQASYTKDFQFSRVDHSELNMDANPVTCKHTHTDNEDKQAVYIPFRQLFGGYGWGVDGVDLGEYDYIEISDITKAQEKFETKFTGDFLYRVGNQNTVSIGSLFAAKDGATINDSGVYVTIDKVDENANVSGTFTANTSDWTNGTIRFSGTGVVKVTIQDYNFCTPTVLTLEVVDAVNATTATSATKNNVVLLNDCGFSSLEVSGGYTLYGNGFTMTCGSDSTALDMGYAFVTLNNGTLDNVQIVCPNFDYAVLYKSNMTESGNRSYTDEAGKTRYYNVKSGVMASGNSQILNSRISGARAAVNVASGNCVIDNSRIELGAVASLLVGAANSVTLRDVTLVQQPTESTYKADGAEKGTTIMGFSVLFVCNSEGDAAPMTIEGTLIQNAWVDENDSQYVPSAGQSIISEVLANEAYTHDLDGDGTKESLNLGFAYMPESLTSKVNTTTITDNRTDNNDVPYDYAEVKIANGNTYVYSYKNTNGTVDSFKTESEYVPNKYSDIIAVNYSDTADGLTAGKSYDTSGWVYELKVDLDKLSGYALDFSKLSMSVNGITITDFTVDGNAKPTSPVAVTAGGTTYTLTATINGKEYTATYKVTGTETSKEPPSLVASNYEAALLVGEAGNTLTKDTWHGAAPALQGIQIKYWSVAEKQYKTITLSDYTPTTAGKQNDTNTTWTYSPDNGDFTLTLTGGQVHSSNNVNAIPVVCNSKLYFVAASSNGLVNYGNGSRTIPVTYSFKDNNGGTELTFSHTWSIECADGNTAYDYSDFCNGTSKTFTIKSSNGSGCVTPDTLVTLADGTQKEIQNIRVGDEVLAWNFYTGKYEVMPVSLLQAHSTGIQNMLHLYFEDGTELKILGEHGVFDADLNTFVFIDENDVESYVGHSFVKQDGEGFTTVKLVGYEVTTEHTTAYTILSANHYNVLAEGMFTVTPAHVGDNFFNPFDIGEDMKYDEEAVKADIEKYGFYTYEDFAHVLTEEQFNALSLAHFKVSVGKGYVTYEGLIYLIENFVNNEDFNV